MIGRRVTEGTHLIPGEVYVARPLPAERKAAKTATAATRRSGKKKSGR
ncbi:MAG TPA: hypothetical protein VM618_08895 [Acidimicrobiia bacterium]|nr:hypothetical protein [Acidimicrobiia bacterium]